MDPWTHDPIWIAYQQAIETETDPTKREKISKEANQYLAQTYWKQESLLPLELGLQPIRRMPRRRPLHHPPQTGLARRSLSTTLSSFVRQPEVARLSSFSQCGSRITSFQKYPPSGDMGNRRTHGLIRRQFRA